MSEQRAERSAPEAPADARAPRRPQPGAACAPRARDEAAACPACGAELRLWANYQRCANCGYKESCCF